MKYDNDLAYIHDQGFRSLAEKAAPEIVRLLRKIGIRSGLIVELGSGSGILAKHLVSSGYRVLGIDQSSSMIRLARKAAPGATFKKGSFFSAKLPACNAVVSTGECISYLFDSRRNLSQFFKHVYSALQPGGLFVFDVMDSAPGKYPQKKFWVGKDWAILFRAEFNAAKQILTRHMITFRLKGNEYRRGEETHRIKILKASFIVRELEKAGFRVRNFRGFGKVKLMPGRSAFVARKLRIKDPLV